MPREMIANENRPRPVLHKAAVATFIVGMKPYVAYADSAPARKGHDESGATAMIAAKKRWVKH
jgi:hypothetical protein